MLLVDFAGGPATFEHPRLPSGPGCTWPRLGPLGPVAGLMQAARSTSCNWAGASAPVAWAILSPQIGRAPADHAGNAAWWACRAMSLAHWATKPMMCLQSGRVRQE